MNIYEMHYDFQSKMNKEFTEQGPYFSELDVDRLLNEAQINYVKKIFDLKEKTKGDIYTYQSETDVLKYLTHTNILLGNVFSPSNKYIFNSKQFYPIFTTSITTQVPTFLYFKSGKCIVSEDFVINGESHKEEKHFEINVFSLSDIYTNNFYSHGSHYWNRAVGFFDKEGDDLNFNIVFPRRKLEQVSKDLSISVGLISSSFTYISYPDKMSYPGYKPILSSNDTIQKDCKLPEHCHSSIVDLAVINATSEIQEPNMNVKGQKIQVNTEL
jgi:hypothetical protein